MTKGELFGRNVKCYAYSMGKGVAQVSMEVGYYDSMVSNVSKNRRNLSAIVIKDFANYFGLSVEELMAEELPEELKKYEKFRRQPTALDYEGTYSPKMKEIIERDIVMRSKAHFVAGDHKPWYKNEVDLPTNDCSTCKYRHKRAVINSGLCAYYEITGHIKTPTGDDETTINPDNSCKYYEKGKAIEYRKADELTKI